MESSNVMRHASPALLSNKPFVLTLVQRSKSKLPVLKHVDAALQADREVVMAAVQCDGNALKYACESLRNDRQVGMAAGGGLKHASAALRNDKELVLRALPMGMTSASEALRDDRGGDADRRALFGVQHAYSIFRTAARHGVRREAVLWQGGAFECIPELEEPCSDVPLRQDRDLILQQSRPAPWHSNTHTLPCRATGRWCSLRCAVE